MPHVPAAGLRAPRIHYRLHGPSDGTALVLIKGLSRSLRHWGGLPDALGMRVVSMDNRGIGLSDRVRFPFGMGDMAADVVRVLDHLRLARAHVFGMSLGGMIAQRVAMDHPTRVDRLVLGCTTPGGKNAEQAGYRTWLALVQARARGLDAAIAAEARATLSPRFIAAHPEIIAAWRAIALEQPVWPETAAMQAAAALCHRVEEDLYRITAPTLIACGDADALVPPSNSRLLARRIRGAEIAWLRGAGHDFATERPAETVAIVRRFLG